MISRRPPGAAALRHERRTAISSARSCKLPSSRVSRTSFSSAAPDGDGEAALATGGAAAGEAHSAAPSDITDVAGTQQADSLQAEAASSKEFAFAVDFTQSVVCQMIQKADFASAPMPK